MAHVLQCNRRPDTAASLCECVSVLVGSCPETIPQHALYADMQWVTEDGERAYARLVRLAECMHIGMCLLVLVLDETD